MKQYEKKGSEIDVFKDFERFIPSEVIDSKAKDGSLVKIGKLPHDKILIARTRSKTGLPTLEIQEKIDGQTRYIKIRYHS